MARGPEFKRMIVGLPQAAGDYAPVEATARFAELLRLNLIAMFAEDRSLLYAAGLPCVRELRSLGGGWQAIDARRFSDELKSSVETARRLFDAIARQHRIETSFRVAQGSPAEIIGSLVTAGDIVAVIEPRHPAEQVSHQFMTLLESAFRAAASVMIVPSRVVRSTGPVVAVATSPQDPSIEAAIGFAGATQERPLVLGPGQLAAALAAESRVQVLRSELAAIAAGALDPMRLLREFERLRERLIVMSRGTIADAAARRLASLRSVPIVVVEPHAET